MGITNDPDLINKQVAKWTPISLRNQNSPDPGIAVPARNRNRAGSILQNDQTRCNLISIVYNDFVTHADVMLEASGGATAISQKVYEGLVRVAHESLHCDEMLALDFVKIYMDNHGLRVSRSASAGQRLPVMNGIWPLLGAIGILSLLVAVIPSLRNLVVSPFGAPGAQPPDSKSTLLLPIPTATPSVRYGRAVPQGAFARLSKGTPFSVAFLPDGQSIAVAAGTGVYLYQTRSAQETWFSDTQGLVRGVAVSSDGTMIAAAVANDIALIDAKTGRNLRILEGHTSAVRSLAFSPDSTKLISGSGDSTAVLWDVKTGAQLHVLAGHTQTVRAVTFSGDGQFVATGSYDDKVILWDVASGKSIRTLEGHKSLVVGVAFSPDSRKLISGSADNRVIVWNVADGQQLSVLEGNPDDDIVSVAYSHSGAMIAAGSLNGPVRIWDANDTHLLRTLDRESTTAYSVGFSPDSTALVSGSWRGDIVVWDVSSGQRLGAIDGFTAPITTLAFDPSGGEITSGSDYGRVITWDIATGTLIKSRSAVGGLYNLPGNKKLLNIDIRQISVVDSSSDSVAYTFSVDNPVRSSTFSGDGSRFAIALSTGGEVSVMDASTGHTLHTIEGFKGDVTSISLSPDGKTLALATSDNAFTLWDVDSGNQLRRFDGPGAAPQRLSFSPDGRLIAAGVNENVTVWDVKSGTQVSNLKGQSSGISTMAFSSDGKIIAFDDLDIGIVLWDVNTGKQIRTLAGQGGAASILAFSPDDQTIASSGLDGTIIFWSVH